MTTKTDVVGLLKGNVEARRMALAWPTFAKPPNAELLIDRWAILAHVPRSRAALLSQTLFDSGVCNKRTGLLCVAARDYFYRTRVPRRKKK